MSGVAAPGSSQGSGRATTLQEQFYAALDGRWERAGSPSTTEMARRAEVEVGQFPHLSPEIYMMPWQSVALFLRGLGEQSSELPYWRDFWERTNLEPDTPVRHLRVVPDELATPMRVPVAGNHKELASVSYRALKATTAPEFVDCLVELRVVSEMSFAAIGKAAGKGMSKSNVHALLTRRNHLPRKDQVEAFARACGASDTVVEIWKRAWGNLAVQRVSKYTSPPTDRDTAVEVEAATKVTPPPTSTEPDPEPASPAVESPASMRMIATDLPSRHAPTVRVRDLLIFAFVVVLLTGCGLAMQTLHVPVDAMICVYVVALAFLWVWVTAQTTSALDPPVSSTRRIVRYPGPDPHEIFGCDEKAYPQVIDSQNKI